MEILERERGVTLMCDWIPLAFSTGVVHLKVYTLPEIKASQNKPLSVDRSQDSTIESNYF